MAARAKPHGDVPRMRFAYPGYNSFAVAVAVALAVEQPDESLAPKGAAQDVRR